MKVYTFIFLMLGAFVLGLSGLSFALTCGSDAGHSQHIQLAKARPGTESQEAVPETNPSSEAVVNEAEVNMAALDAGNKICPVSGEKISDVSESGMMPATYEYQGKIYNFCCTGCIDEFKKDPGKYVVKVEEELKAAQSEPASQLNP
jgi:YHS domain-containing protein